MTAATSTAPGLLSDRPYRRLVTNGSVELRHTVVSLSMSQVVMRVPSYRRRVVDDELDQLFSVLAALAIDGPKGVGKTSTALERAATVFELDSPAVVEVLRADPSRLTAAHHPIVIDEWQRFPPAWDLVRRSVDRSNGPGQFILTGSASPKSPETHSGAARIVPVRMRPLTLPERGVDTPSVSLSVLLAGGRPPIDGSTTVSLEQYVDEILGSGFPGMRHASGRARRGIIDGYLQLVVDRDFPDAAGRQVRNPSALRRWMAAYAAATSTTAAYDTIRDAASHRQETPAKTTTQAYRDTLERMWILDPVPAWVPSRSHLSRLNEQSKHQLCDPAFAAALVRANASTLLSGSAGDIALPRDGTFLGALFESLAALDLRVFAQHAEARVFHLRTKAGEHEVDFIVERPDGSIVAVEVKLSATVDDAHVAQLRWLSGQIGTQLIDSIVLTTGRNAYRRPDGVAVVPLALLGP